MTKPKYPSWDPKSRHAPEPVSAPVLTGWGGNRPGTSQTNLNRRNLKERDKAAAPISCREYQPISQTPVYDPMKSRAFRVAMERIDINKRVASLGRK